jgi:hypothetical protein
VSISFDDLEGAPLLPGEIYRGGNKGGKADEVLSKLIPKLKNSGGIRHVGNWQDPKLIVLTSTYGHRVWPDRLSVDAQNLTYFGDNRSKDRGASETIGNRVLLSSFKHSQIDKRCCPPILYFVSTGNGSDQMFIGLFTLGDPSLQEYEWLSKANFQQGPETYENFVFKLSRLKSNEVPREWVEACVMGGPTLRGAPESWRRWVEDSVYQLAEPDFGLAAGVTSANIEEIGTRFLNLCDRKHAGDVSTLIWVVSSVMLHSTGFLVKDVNKSKDIGVFEIQVESRRRSPIFGSNLHSIRARLETVSTALGELKESQLIYEIDDSTDLKVSSWSIGIELDRVGIRTPEDIEKFLKQCLV